MLLFSLLHARMVVGLDRPYLTTPSLKQSDDLIFEMPLTPTALVRPKKGCWLPGGCSGSHDRRLQQWAFTGCGTHGLRLVGP